MSSCNFFLWKENARSEVLSCLNAMNNEKEPKSKKEAFLEFQKSRLEGMTVETGKQHEK